MKINKNGKNQARQGDVFGEIISGTLPADVRKKKLQGGKWILAIGESRMAQHIAQPRAEGDVLEMWEDDNYQYILAKEIFDIVHTGTHDSIPSSGFGHVAGVETLIRIGVQSEYTPESIKRVAD